MLMIKNSDSRWRMKEGGGCSVCFEDVCVFSGEECVKERGNGSMVFTPSFNPLTSVGYLYYKQM